MTIADLMIELGVDASGLSKGFQTAEQTLEKVGTQMFFLGSRITAGVGVPLTAAIATISKFGLEFDKAMTESLAIVQNVTPQMRAEMEGVAKDIARTTKFSAAEAAEGYYSLASAGLDAASMMGALPVAARFAQAGVMDLAQASEYLAAAQATLGDASDSAGKKVADMAKIADVLTMANNLALGTVKDFADALTNKAGAQLRLFNKTVEEGTAVLAAYAQQGIIGKNAGTQLYMMTRDLARANINNTEEWKKHGIAVFNAAGEMRKFADILKDFETRMDGATDKQRRMILMQLGMQDRSLAATQALIGFSDAIRVYEEALLNAGGTTQKVADNQMLAFTNQLKKLMNELEIVAIELFEAFVPTINNLIIPAIKQLLDMIKGFAQTVGGLPEPLKLTGLALAGIAIAAGPVIAVLGSMSLLTAAAFRGVGQLAQGLGALSTTFGLAAGGTQTYVQMSQGLVTAQTAVHGALGLAATSGKAVVLTTSQLAQATKIASDTAILGASAMGVYGRGLVTIGRNASDAVVESNKLAKGAAAVGAALNAAAAPTSLWARALGFLTNPITLVIAGIGALIATYVIWQQKQEMNRRAMIENADAYRAETEQLEVNLIRYKSLNDAQSKNEEQNRMLAESTKGLADASGLTAEAYSREISRGNDLIAVKEKELAIRKTLFNQIVEETRGKVIAAEQELAKAQGQLDELMGKRLIVPGQFQPQVGKMLMPELTPGTEEHKDRVMELQRIVADLGKTAKESKVELDKLLGVKPRGAPIVMADIVGLSDADMGKFRANYMANLEQMMRDQEVPLDQIAAALLEAGKAWNELMGIGKDKPLQEDPTGAKKKKEELDEFTKAVIAMKKELSDWGEFDALVMMETWAQLMKDSKGDIVNNTKAMDEMFEVYTKWKGATGEIIPLFEDLLAAQIRQASETQRINEEINLWGVTMSDAAQKMVTEATQVQEALANMTPRQLNAWMEQHGKTVEELIPWYDELGFQTQNLIGVYQAWKIGIANATGELDKNARKVEQTVGTFAKDVTAKLIDAQTELALFSQSYLDKETAGLRKGLAAREKELDQHYDKALAEVISQSGQQGAAWTLAQLDILNKARAHGQELLAIESRVGLLRLAESAGIHERIIRNHKDFTDDQIKELIRLEKYWADFFEELNKRIKTLDLLGTAIGKIGTMFEIPGMESFGETLGKMAAGAAQVSQGLEMMKKSGATFADKMNGWITVGIGVIDMFQGIRDAASKTEAVMAGVMTGAQLGGQIGTMTGIPGAGLIGAGIGAGIGALVGFFGGKSQWRELQDDIEARWDVHVSEALAKKIRETAKIAGGEANAMMIHIAEVIEEGGGITVQNVNTWAGRVRDAFSGLQTGALDAGQAAQILDDTFADLVESGTSTSGVLSGQVLELVKLEQQYQTGSKAIKEYVQAQLDVAAGGFELVVKGVFGDLLTEDEDKLEDLKDEIEAFSKTGQEQFDRLGRMALVTFGAMMESGVSMIDALNKMGPALDALVLAQDRFGFASSESFGQLMKFREFAALHPELVGMMTGLQQMMTGLHNAGFMTDQMFTDLGATVVDTFNKAVAGGLSSDEAMQMMQPTLQTLWEMQQAFGYKVDDTTQALIDEAEASGKVGEKYMSANDKMVLGIDKLNLLLQAFLKHLGVDVPEAAKTAAQKLADEINRTRFNPIVIPYNFQQQGPSPPGGSGGGGTEAPEDVPGHHERPNEPTMIAAGGKVAYAAAGMLVEFKPKGTDTVPAMLTPGEGIVNVKGMRTLGEEGLNALNRGIAQVGMALYYQGGGLVKPGGGGGINLPDLIGGGPDIGKLPDEIKMLLSLINTLLMQLMRIGDAFERYLSPVPFEMLREEAEGSAVAVKDIPPKTSVAVVGVDHFMDLQMKAEGAGLAVVGIPDQKRSTMQEVGYQLLATNASGADRAIAGIPEEKRTVMEEIGYQLLEGTAGRVTTAVQEIPEYRTATIDGQTYYILDQTAGGAKRTIDTIPIERPANIDSLPYGTLRDTAFTANQNIGFIPVERGAWIEVAFYWDLAKAANAAAEAIALIPREITVTVNYVQTGAVQPGQPAPVGPTPPGGGIRPGPTTPPSPPISQTRPGPFPPGTTPAPTRPPDPRSGGFFGIVPSYGTGAHLSGQNPHMAVVGDANEWIVRDPDFRNIMRGAAEVGARGAAAPGAEGGGMVVVQEGGVQVTVTAPYVTTQADWISKDITHGVLKALGNNDEPGYEAAILRIVERALERHQ